MWSTETEPVLKYCFASIFKNASFKLEILRLPAHTTQCTSTPVVMLWDQELAGLQRWFDLTSGNGQIITMNH